jgi:hypothetical protein
LGVEVHNSLEFTQAQSFALTIQFNKASRFLLQELDKLRSGATKLFRSDFGFPLLLSQDIQRLRQQGREGDVLIVDTDSSRSQARLP